MSQNEQLAIAIGSNKALLRKRLNDAKAVLQTVYARLFSTPIFDFENKYLWSNDRKFALVWKLRNHPDQKESYENQQTNRGTVMLYEIR
jgi:hypothetical protein